VPQPKHRTLNIEHRTPNHCHPFDSELDASCRISFAGCGATAFGFGVATIALWLGFVAVPKRRGASLPAAIQNGYAGSKRTFALLQRYLPTSSHLARILARGFCFLSRRRRSGERTEEKGDPRQTHLLSPPLSSIRWRRGSCFGCGLAALWLWGQWGRTGSAYFSE
jgi:hypothetical protein